MDAMAIMGFILGLAALAKVHSLGKQVYLLRSDLKLATGKSESGEGEGGSCGCGGNC
jgi:hypothetical protein